MDGTPETLISRLLRLISKPAFWLIVALLALITLPHYGEALPQPAFLTHATANLGLTRHSFERILYLAPIVWAGFLFGWWGAFITSLAALICMLPRVAFISVAPLDAFFETGAVFVVGNVLAVSFDSLRRERERRAQLEATQQELRTSEERYRELFENAHDAIWLHDLDKNIVAANRACIALTGYEPEELYRLNANSLFPAESLAVIHGIEQGLLGGKAASSIAEIRLIRKDKSEAFVQLATSLVFNQGEVAAFQHIARDVTEQRRMQENLRFYLQQAIRAQEEERKRISRELHDSTIQSLVVLSRQLDTLTSGDKKLPADTPQRLEKLRQQTSNIMDEVRRLSQDLRPAALDRLGLLSVLEGLASDVAQYSGVKTKVNLVGTERRLPEEVALVLFRITQEALRNVWRHAEATEAEVTVEFEPKQTRVTVSDNGKGFDLPRAIGDLARDGKLGLAGMQERAQLLGGILKAQSEPGKGTRITVELPL